MAAFPRGKGSGETPEGGGEEKGNQWNMDCGHDMMRWPPEWPEVNSTTTDVAAGRRTARNWRRGIGDVSLQIPNENVRFVLHGRKERWLRRHGRPLARRPVRNNWRKEIAICIQEV